ncbi:MAG: YARHG domain-containing protein [Clostridium sp.]
MREHEVLIILPAIEEIGLSERFYTRTELTSAFRESFFYETPFTHTMGKFKTDSLNEYFQQKIWYRGRIEPEAFAEELLTDTERANVQLIRELENIPFEERVKEGYRGPEGIYQRHPIFPLNQEGESSPHRNPCFRDTGISFDMAQAEDRERILQRLSYFLSCNCYAGTDEAVQEEGRKR